jgi:phi13 family phage major tail protein
MSATRIGCDHAVVAKLTEGTDGTPTYATIMPLPGLVKMNVNPNASLETMFYDDGPGDTASTLGKIEVEFEKNALAIAESAFLLGHTVDTNGALVSAADDTPPWVALGFRSQKSDGTYKYVWLYKGKFSDPEMQNETKKDSINFQTDTIKGQFVKLNKEYTIGGKTRKPWKIEADEGDTGLGANLLSKWFDAPVLPNASLAG